MKTILLIDDDTFMLESLSDVLEDFGFTVLQAPNGGRARGIFTTQTVDLVISDYNLPDTLGTTLANEMKAKDGQIKIILMSGLNASEIKDSQLVDLILGKPVDPSVLIQAIQKLLI